MVRDQLDINSSVNNQAEVLLLDNGLELIVKEMPVYSRDVCALIEPPKASIS